VKGGEEKEKVLPRRGLGNSQNPREIADKYSAGRGKTGKEEKLGIYAWVPVGGGKKGDPEAAGRKKKKGVKGGIVDRSQGEKTSVFDWGVERDRRRRHGKERGGGKEI